MNKLFPRGFLASLIAFTLLLSACGPVSNLSAPEQELYKIQDDASKKTEAISQMSISDYPRLYKEGGEVAHWSRTNIEKIKRLIPDEDSAAIFTQTITALESVERLGLKIKELAHEIEKVSDDEVAEIQTSLNGFHQRLGEMKAEFDMLMTQLLATNTSK